MKPVKPAERDIEHCEKCGWMLLAEIANHMLHCLHCGHEQKRKIV